MPDGNVIDLSGVDGPVGIVTKDPYVLIMVRWPMPGKWNVCEFKWEGVDDLSAPILLEIASKTLKEHVLNGGQVETIENVGPDQVAAVAAAIPAAAPPGPIPLG